MKIKCSKCKKRFDPDVYSGLCPKCGTYNGKRSQDTLGGEYIKSRAEAEAAHRQLHQEYDSGYEAAHPSYEEDTHSDGQSNKSDDTFYSGQSYSSGSPSYGGSTTAGQSDQPGGSAGSAGTEIPAAGFEGRTKERQLSGGRLILIFFGMVFLAVLIMSGVLFFMTKKAIREVTTLSYKEVNPQFSGQAVFMGELLDYPIHVEVQEAGFAGDADGLQGKVLYGVKVSVETEEEMYNFDARMGRPFLSYTSGGDTYYKTPIDSDAISAVRREVGLSHEDLLSDYGVGGGGEPEEGYWFFVVEEDAADFALVLQIYRTREPALLWAEAVLPLDGIVDLPFVFQEVTP